MAILVIGARSANKKLKKSFFSDQHLKIFSVIPVSCFSTPSRLIILSHLARVLGIPLVEVHLPLAHLPLT